MDIRGVDKGIGLGEKWRRWIRNDEEKEIKVGMKLGCVSSMFVRKCSRSTSTFKVERISWLARFPSFDHQSTGRKYHTIPQCTIRPGDYESNLRRRGNRTR